MTARPHLDDRDPAEEIPWRPVSSEWRREEAKRATAEAVRRSKESRMKPKESTDDIAR